MMQIFSQIRAALSALPVVGDLGPYAALSLALWATAYLVRRYRPSWWKRVSYLSVDPESSLSHLVQALPVTVLGAVFAGATTGEVEQVAFGGLCGVGAVLLHHALKAVPLPYRGAINDAATKYAAERKRRIGLGSLVLLAVGCAPPPSAVPNDAEATCIALEVARKELEVKSCGANVEGPCSSKSIMERSMKERHACLEKH